MQASDELSTQTVLPAPNGQAETALKLDDLVTDSESEGEGGDEEATSIDIESELVMELKELGIVAWVSRRLQQGLTPVDMLALFDIKLPADLPDAVEPMHVLKLVLGRILSKREKRADINTTDDAVRLIREARNIVVLTGAGVSTAAGIPDFRSSTGIYAKLAQESNGELTDPQEMFDIDFFRENPTIFYRFARDLYPSNFKPTASHRFIKLLENRKQLLRNYSQNIDTLEQAAGIERVLNCHGSFATARCIVCGLVVPGDLIKEDIFAQRVPLCLRCTAEQAAAEPAKPPLSKKRKLNAKPWDDTSDDENDNGLAPSEWLGKPVLKPQITFFGEKLDDTFGEHLSRDREHVDLLLVMGTSLKVAPVSDVLSHIPHSIPQILINRDPVPHCGFDVVLLGDCDGAVRWLCKQLGEGWSVDAPENPRRVGRSHVWVFEGANEEHRWLRALEASEAEITSDR